MRRKVILCFAIVACNAAAVAADCPSIPPCMRLHAGAIFFVGTAVEVGTPNTLKGVTTRAVRLRVDEAFMGVPTGAKEMVVDANADWLQKGHSYLIDAFNRSDDWMDLTSCGASGEITSAPAIEMVRFLRARATGTPATSFTVTALAPDQVQPLAGANVTAIAASGEVLMALTNSRGVATFEGIAAGHYNLSATLEHYRFERRRLFEGQVDVIAGACPSVNVALRPEMSVSGVLTASQGGPVLYLRVQLVPVSKTMKPLSADTDNHGAFRFGSVVPGKYILGLNIVGLDSSPFPPTYYPGVFEKTGAKAIEVKLGDQVSNLTFTLPSFGDPRQIQICVIDAQSKPVPSVRLLNVQGGDNPRRASLGETLMTGETGCASATGFTKIQYAIRASKWFYNGAPALDSEPVVIEPGDAPAHVKLVLKQAK